MTRSPSSHFRSTSVVGSSLALVLLLCGACVLPPLDQQRDQILKGKVTLHRLSLRAFLGAWGPPTYEREEYTQFFVVEDGSYVPGFRVPLGESPKGWSSVAVSGEGRFLGYAERGELLGFLDDRLVYRERMAPADIHAVGEQWKREARFKTRLETPPSR